MEIPFATLVVIGLFLLRLGVPIGVIVLVSYVLHRLDAKWEAEAAEYRRRSAPHA